MDYAGTSQRLTSGRTISSGARALGWLVALVALAGTACQRASPPPAPDAAGDVPLDVSFAGCASVVALRGVVCEVAPPRKLRIVVPERARDVVLRAGDASDAGAPLLSRVERRDPATVIHHVDVPDGVERIVVRAFVGDRPASFVLHLATARPIPWADEAKALRAKGNVAGARAIAEAHAGAGDDGERAAAADLLARLTLAEGHAEQAFPLFRAAIAAHRAAGRISDAADDSFALAFALHQRSHRYDEARAALDAVATDLDAYPEGRARAPYYRGILASETGDRRTALTLLRESEVRARALGMARLERNARAALALDMQVLGRIRESMDVLKALERDPEVVGCERVEVANDLGWGALLANEAAANEHEDAQGPLERAASATDCSDAYLRSFALGNLARLAMAKADVARAQTYLAEARAAVKDPRGTERLSWLDLEARVLLAQHVPERALARFDEERSLAKAGVLLEPEWSALVGRAEALDALGRRADAVTALAAAEDVLDRAMLLVPLGEGRGAFVADRSRSARLAIDLLVALGRSEDAARVARRSRTRVLASVERALRIELLSGGDRAKWEIAVRAYRGAREAIDAEAAGDWKLPADALARATEARQERERALRASLESAMAVLTHGSPDQAAGAGEEPALAGDLEIVVHPGKTGWIAFATDATRTTSHVVPAPASSPAELGAALFDPIASRVLAARRVRVRAFGGWRNVDVHALPFKGAPLLEQVAVDYPLGLRASAGAGSATFERRAVIVGDPSGNLARAKAEAMLVSKALEPRLPLRLFLGTEAVSAAVAAQLPHAGLFHYAGHGRFESAGLASTLELAEGGRLSAGDFLALAPAPRKVVLSGCDAARTNGESDDLGLAQALVAAGAEEVLAPVHAISDVLAERLAAALYAGAAGDAACDLAGSGSLATAARIALLEVRKADPSSGWEVFRVLAR